MAWIPQKTTLRACADLLAAQGNLVAQKNLCAHEKLIPEKPLTGQTGFAAPAPSAFDSEQALTQLSYNSQTVKPGALFFCKGIHFKPDYLIQAAQAGITAYVSEVDYTEDLAQADAPALPVMLVHDIRTALADVAAFYYRGLLDHLTLIGFTGTKGKSTTTYMLRAILDSWLTAQGKKESAWLSTIDNYDGVSRTRSPLTTQDVLELYHHFENAVANGIEYLTMEVSSQALKYHRTRNLTFEVGGFLNLGEDHISDIEHPTHEDYFASKLLLFAQSRSAVVNLESEGAERILEAAELTRKTFTYTTKSSSVCSKDCFLGVEPTVCATNIEATSEGLSFTAVGPSWQQHFTIPMAGLFNVENALAAITTAEALGIPVEHMQQGLAHSQVSGRMQLILGPEEKLIIIDYAHNKMSFETIFATVAKEYPGRQIVAVFGATGGKGAERRLEMPAVAVQYASTIYITEDDAGEEPLQQINSQIAAVVEAAGTPYRIIEDRSEAIAAAIEESPRGSLILVLGKGHETVMKRGVESVLVPSDTERVEKILHHKG